MVTLPQNINKKIKPTNSKELSWFLCWWAEKDSNLRTRMRTDLQSAAFSRSAICPEQKYYKIINAICQDFF